MKIKIIIIVGVVSAIIGVVTVVFALIAVGKRPENEMSKSFVCSSTVVSNLFGSSLTIKHKPGRSGISFFSDGRVEGRYGFTVKGNEKSGLVEVFWRRESKEGDFQVYRLELMKRQAKSEVIWQKFLTE